MSHRRRTLGTALGAFLVGGLTVGIAMGIAGALPETDGGIALGALLVFPLFFRVLFGFFFLALLLRFIGGRRRWAMGGPTWAQQWGDPRSRLEEWHQHAHAEPETDDQNAPSEDHPRR
ncbi:MAG: hypothetical protein OEQ47_01085 [Acidimicrobiia bacterium]|nr:hypothetical protein [Acidimicrobiia bacterium]